MPLTERDLLKGDTDSVQENQKGAYKLMHKEMTAVLAACNNSGLTYPEEHDIDYALISLGGEPWSIDEALHDPNAKEWEKGLKYEIDQLELLHTWVIDDLPDGQAAIPCSEVLKEKHGPNGEVQTYQICIVAGGYKQIKEINYTETFTAAATKLPLVRLILVNMAKLNWKIHYVDVKSTYLNTPLKEKVYMKIPRGAMGQGEKGKVCSLLKGMYGLNQAGRGWHQELMKVFVQDLKFMLLEVNHPVFYKKGVEEHTIVAVATDHMIVISQCIIDVQDFKSWVWKHWEITNMEDNQWYTGFEIKQDRKVWTVSNQSAHT